MLYCSHQDRVRFFPPLGCSTCKKILVYDLGFRVVLTGLNRPKRHYSSDRMVDTPPEGAVQGVRRDRVVGFSVYAFPKHKRNSMSAPFRKGCSLRGAPCGISCLITLQKQVPWPAVGNFSSVSLYSSPRSYLSSLFPNPFACRGGRRHSGRSLPSGAPLKLRLALAAIVCLSRSLRRLVLFVEVPSVGREHAATLVSFQKPLEIQL